jgi:hypothetical protein
LEEFGDSLPQHGQYNPIHLVENASQGLSRGLLSLDMMMVITLAAMHMQKRLGAEEVGIAFITPL